jgi:hypothetical protein
VDKPESKIKADVRAYLRAHKGIVDFCYIPGEPGVPDRIGCIPIKITRDVATSLLGREIGLFYGVEVKRRGKHLNPNQKAMRKRLKKAGAIVIRVSSAEQVKRIEKYLRRKFYG